MDPVSPVDMGRSLGFSMREGKGSIMVPCSYKRCTLLPCGAEALGARTLAVRREWRGLG